MPSVGTASIDLEVDKHQLGRSINSAASGVGGQVKSTFGSLGKLASAAFGAAVVVKGVDFLGDSIAEAREAAKVGRLTEQVIKSTGGAAKVSSGDVGKLADKLSALAGVDDEVIQSGENLLLTFTNVRNGVGKGNDIFNQATASAVDMSAALGQDMQSSVIQLGKALNDPIKGVTALSRVGVSFTKDQKEQIKTLVESGKTLDAQKIILKELNTEFGGAAAAAADPAQKLAVVWGNFKETIGTALLPILNTVVGFLAAKLPGAVDKAKRVLGPFFGGIKQVLSVLFKRDFVGGGPFAEDSPFIAGVFQLRDKALPIIKKVIAFIRDDLPRAAAIAAGAFLLFTGPVTAVVATLAILYLKFKGVRDVVDAVVRFVTEQFQHFADFIGSILPQVQEAIGHFVSVVQAAWHLWGDDIINFARGVWQQIAGVIQIAVSLVEGIIRVFLAVINGDWGKAWDAIKDMLSGVWNGIRQVIGGQLDVVKGIFGAAFDAIKSIVEGAMRWVVDKFLAAVEWIIRGAASAFGWVPGIGGKLKSAAKEFEQFRDDVNASLGGIKDKTVNVKLSLAQIPTASGSQLALAAIGGGLPAPKRARGGAVDTGRLYEVGEHGRAELLNLGGRQYLIPGARGQVISAQDFAGSMSQNEGEAPTVHTTIVMDDKVLAESMSRGIYERETARVR